MLETMSSTMLVLAILMSYIPLAIVVGTQTLQPIPFLSIVDIESMDSNASPQHFFKTYVAGRVIEMNASQLPFLQNIDPRYLHVLIYDGKEFIEIPVRIYTKVIHFNSGSSLSGELYVVPKKMSSNTVIDIKLPPIYPKPLDSNALSRLPTYLRGSILYPTTIEIRLENGKKLRIPIIFAIAKVRNIEVTKNSIDYDNVVEDFELYGVGGFYRHLLELTSRGIVLSIRRLVEQYTNSVLDVSVEAVKRPVRVAGNVLQWNVVEITESLLDIVGLGFLKHLVKDCRSYPCTMFVSFRYQPSRDETISGTVTELILYRINVLPLDTFSLSSMLCRLVVDYYTNGSWHRRTYYVDPSTRNMVWLALYFPSIASSTSRILVTLEECPVRTMLAIDTIAAAHYVLNIENSVLSNKTLDLYPLGSPNASCISSTNPVPSVQIYVGPKDPNTVTILNVLPIPILQALLYKFANTLNDSYNLELLVKPMASDMDASIQICIGLACSDIVDVKRTSKLILTLKPEDILSYYEALRNVPVTITVWRRSKVFAANIAILNAPIKILARPVNLGFDPDTNTLISTSLYADNSTIWWIPGPYAVRGEFVSNYIAKPYLDGVGIPKGFVIRSAFLTSNEFANFESFAITHLEIRTEFASMTYVADTRSHPSLRYISIEIRCKGVNYAAFDRVRIGIPGGGYVPGLLELPLPIIIVVPLRDLPKLINALTRIELSIYSAWHSFFEYLCRPYIRMEKEREYVRFVYAPSPTYESKMFFNLIELEFFEVPIHIRYRVVKVVQVIEVEQGGTTIRLRFSDSFTLSLVPTR